jgi:hypothetical protein
MAIWYIFSRFGMFNQEKSGNPASKRITIFVRFPLLFRPRGTLQPKLEWNSI